jgi:hypothetical protein
VTLFGWFPQVQYKTLTVKSSAYLLPDHKVNCNLRLPAKPLLTTMVPNPRSTCTRWTSPTSGFVRQTQLLAMLLIQQESNNNTSSPLARDSTQIPFMPSQSFRPPSMEDVHLRCSSRHGTACSRGRYHPKRKCVWVIISQKKKEEIYICSSRLGLIKMDHRHSGNGRNSQH